MGVICMRGCFGVFASFVFASLLLDPSGARALTLEDAVQEALASNPEILKAAENREATEFELRQARGLYLPTIDLESSVGSRQLDSPGRRRLGTENDSLDAADVGLTVRQTLFDGGNTRAQVDHQAARVDGASFRVAERSEAIALAVSQEYFEILLQAEIVEISKRNAGVLGQIVSNISSGVAGGTLTDADRVQGSERLLSARARLKEAEEDLDDAKIRFYRLTGLKFDKAKFPPNLHGAVPSSPQRAVEIARLASPRLAATRADIDAADALVRGARANYLPTISLEGRARAGHDIDGAEGRTTDLEAKVVARWNLYRGGRDVAAEQERIRRAGEARQDNQIAYREVEESVRTAWNRRTKRAQQARIISEQVAAGGQLVASYREQFQVGERSLLDVLSAQNTRYSNEILAKTAAYAANYADYQVLAAMGGLVSALKLGGVAQSEPYAREEFQVESLASDVEYRRIPSRQVSGEPFDLLKAIAE